MPLEKRFDESYEDIRYSIEKSDDELTSRVDQEIEKDTTEKALKDTNRELARTMLELKGEKVADFSTFKIVKKIKNDFNVDLSLGTIRQELDKVVNAIDKASGDITKPGVNEAANNFVIKEN